MFFFSINQVLLVLTLLTLSTLAEDNKPKHPAYHSSSKGEVKDVVLVVSQKNVAADCTVRPSTVLNGSLPGPTLRFKEGDHIRIKVINKLETENTTIHFHGLSQRGSPFSDGTQKISQWAIPPRGGTFEYEFKLEKGSAGTYMYHAHAHFQVGTAYGALIVEDDSEPPYKYDEDRVMMLGDYYHSVDKEILGKLLGAPFAWPGDPQSVLVNGNALNTCNTSSTYGCENNCGHHVIYVQPEKVYRFRVAGITALSYLFMAIESHPAFEIIEVDAGYVKKFKTDHLQVNSGQRYSFLLKTKSRAELKLLKGKTSFWARLESRFRSTRTHGQFLIQYDLSEKGVLLDHPKTSHLHSRAVPKLKPKKDSDDLVTEKTLPPELLAFQKLIPIPSEDSAWSTFDFEPHSLKNIPKSSEVDRRIIIRGQQLKSADGSIKWYANGQAYQETEPQVPFLVRAYTSKLKPDYEAAAKNNGFDPKLQAYPIKLKEVVELVFINVASGAGVTEAHPWHIHGKKPVVVARGLGNFTLEALAREEAKNKHPIQRDTEVILPGKGASYLNETVAAGTETSWFVMRLKANEAGAMLVHCHTQAHAIMGMAVVLLIGIDDLPKLPSDVKKEFFNSGENPPPPESGNEPKKPKPPTKEDNHSKNKN